MNRVHVIVLLALSLINAGGCASIDPPEVFLTDLEMLDGGMLEQRVRVGLRVLNPNDVALPVRGLDFKLDLNGMRLARGVSDAAFEVPAFGETTASITASSSVIDIARQVLRLSTHPGDAVAYRIVGRAHFDRSSAGAVGGLPLRISFDRSGALQMDDLGSIFEARGGLAPPIMDGP